MADDPRARVPADELIPGQASLGCLVIHGLTGTPHEMAPVAAALAGRYPVWLARVAGHATRVEDLATTSWQDWHESAARGARALLTVAPRIVVVGLSMGGLLAIRLAVTMERQVAGVALLSTAVALGGRVPRWLGPPLGVLALLDARYAAVRARMSRIMLNKGRSDIADQAVLANHPGYRQVPLRALLNLVALQRLAAADAPRVTQPGLVIHATHDHTSPIDAARTLYARMGSTDKRLVVLEESFHVITVDRERERVVAEVVAFVDRIAGQTRADRRVSGQPLAQ